MGQGKATEQSEYQKRIDAAKDRMMNSPDAGVTKVDVEKRVGARPESGIRNTFKRYDPNRKYQPPRTGFAVDDPDRKYEPPIPRTDLFNRAGGQNLMPVNKPAIAGQKPRSLSGEIESDFIDYRKPKRMGGY